MSPPPPPALFLALSAFAFACATEEEPQIDQAEQAGASESANAEAGAAHPGALDPLDLQMELDAMECGPMTLSAPLRGADTTLFAAERFLSCDDMQALFDAELALASARRQATTLARMDDHAGACGALANAWVSLEQVRTELLGAADACVLHDTEDGLMVDRMQALNVRPEACDTEADYAILATLTEMHEPLFLVDTARMALAQPADDAPRGVLEPGAVASLRAAASAARPAPSSALHLDPTPGVRPLPTVEANSEAAQLCGPLNEAPALQTGAILASHGDPTCEDLAAVMQAEAELAMALILSDPGWQPGAQPLRSCTAVVDAAEALAQARAQAFGLGSCVAHATPEGVLVDRVGEGPRVHLSCEDEAAAAWTLETVRTQLPLFVGDTVEMGEGAPADLARAALQEAGFSLQPSPMVCPLP